MKFRENSFFTMDLTVKRDDTMDLTAKQEGTTLYAQGLSQSARKMSLNLNWSQGDTLQASESSPTYGTSNDTFPYGLSGVAMPNYGYPGDLYQFTSNGYPRKSRTCCYCGKVFTRSTTRRYHEKRCPLLRAAVCGIVPDNGKRSNGPAGSLPQMTSPSLSQSLERKSLSSTSSSVMGGVHPSPHYTATSRITTPPPLLAVKREQENGLGYHTSVIVKQELQDHLMKHEHNHEQPPSIPSSTHEYPGILNRLTPDSNGSSPKLAKGMGELGGFPPSPFHMHSGLTVSKSPSVASQKDDTNSTTLETQVVEESGIQNGKQNGLDEDEIPDGESFQERMKYDEAHANDLNLTSPGGGERSSLLMDTLETTSPNLSHEQQLEAISDAEDSKNETTESINNDFVDSQTKCGVCGKLFESAWKLHVHEQIHTKFKPYACRFCGLRFSKAALRITHEKLHLTEPPLLCAICGDTFTRRESLHIHVSSRHSEGPWLCRHCGKAAMTHQELIEHFQTHSVAKEEMLSLQFFLQGTMTFVNNNNDNDNDDDVNDSELINDSEQLNDSENLNDSEFISMSDSNDNDNSMISPEPVEDGVDSVIPAKPDLLISEDTEMCTMCGRDIPKSHMKYHLKAHEGQKPYECPICAKRFGYKNNMKSHIKLHAGIKPYQCNVCGAKFTRGSTLRRHARRHGISAESVWDLFVKNGSSGQHQPSQIGQTQVPARNQADTLMSSPPSPGLSSSKVMSSSASFSDSPGYGSLINTATSAAMSNALLMSYHNHQAAIAAASYPSLFSPLQSTSDVPLHTAGFATSSHTPQKDALNLTIGRSVAALPQSDLNGNNRNLIDSISPTSAERSRSRSLSGSDISRPTPISAPSMTGNGHDIGVQVKTCCKMNIENLYPGIGSPSEASVQSGDSGAIYQQGLSSGLEYSNDTISTLLNTGRLFKCDHCECYFSEYAMYRIHSKIHTRGRTMPFVCPVCGEDCHDRVYFSLHISEHLK